MKSRHARHRWPVMTTRISSPRGLKSGQTRSADQRMNELSRRNAGRARTVSDIGTSSSCSAESGFHRLVVKSTKVATLLAKSKSKYNNSNSNKVRKVSFFDDFLLVCSCLLLFGCTADFLGTTLALFGLPFVKRFALCHRTVVCPVCLGVGVLWPNG